MRFLLIITYPLLVVAAVGNRLLDRDPLRLKRPGGDSFWIRRDKVPDRGSYFEERSVAEGRGHGGISWLAAVVLVGMSRWYAPRRAAPGEQFTPAADREEGIPDEVYTLW